MKPRSLEGVMKRVSILYLAIIAVLLGVIAVMAYTFLVAGKTVTAEDKRSAIVLEPSERALVLGEMRGFDVPRPWRTPCGRVARVQFCAPGKIV